MPDHTTAVAIESELDVLPDKIEAKCEEKNAALEEYRRAEAGLENQVAQVIQREKALIIGQVDAQLSVILQEPKAIADKKLKVLKMKMPTIEDLKAVATQETYLTRLDVITKESAWRARVNEYETLLREFDILKEKSYNYRQGLKTLRG